jgi:hypothetical protein
MIINIEAERENRSLKTSLHEFNCTVLKTKLNSVALVHKRTIPTERPLHVGEVTVLC